MTKTATPAIERVKHKKRGSTYTIIARGRLQVDGDLDNEKVTVYRGETDGDVWVRPDYEFNDGRFEVLPSIAASPPTAVEPVAGPDGIGGHDFQYTRDVETLQRCLWERDSWIVSKGLWGQFTASLPHDRRSTDLREENERLENEVVLRKAAYDGVGSLLLEVQQDCNAEHNRATTAEARITELEAEVMELRRALGLSETLSKAVHKQAVEAENLVEKVHAENAEAKREARILAQSMWQQSYSDISGWQMLDDTAGIITQISNMAAGIRDRAATLSAENANLTAHNKALVEALKYIAKTWPDDFSARHARAALAREGK